MKRNDIYLGPGRGPSPAELERDSDFAECLRCGEHPTVCVCEGGPWMENEDGPEYYREAEKRREL